MINKQKVLKIKSLIKNIPYYEKEIYKKDFALFPIITKDDVLKNYDLFQKNHSKGITVLTSGSSGHILKVNWETSDYSRSLSYLWKLRKERGINVYDRFCTLHVCVKTSSGYINNKVIIEKNSISFSKNFTDNSSFSFYYNQILEFEPVWMLFQPSFLFSFVNYLVSEGKDFPKCIKYIEMNGEYFSKEMEEFFDSFFSKYNIKIFNMYGMREFNGIAYGKGEALDIIDENVILEILDDNGYPVDNGVEGNIIVSTLVNSKMPLVRYKSCDRGYITDEKKLIITAARSNDSFVFENQIYDGSIFWSAINILNSSINNTIRQFKVILKDNIFHFYLVLNSYYDEKIIEKYLSNILSCRMGFNNMDIIIHISDKICCNDQSNKIKYFINES